MLLSDFSNRTNCSNRRCVLVYRKYEGGQKVFNETQIIRQRIILWFKVVSFELHSLHPMFLQLCHHRQILIFAEVLSTHVCLSYDYIVGNKSPSGEQVLQVWDQWSLKGKLGWMN